MNKNTNLVTHNLKTRAFKKYLKSIYNLTQNHYLSYINVKFQLNPNKMSIRAAPYLHQKSANRALDIMLAFIEVLVLMLLCKFVLNSTFRRYSKL